MKKLLLSLSLISGFAYSQNATEFTLTKENGITDYIVTEVIDKSKEDIYKKVVGWINRRYQKADTVIQGQVENEYIRFRAIDNNTLCKNPDNKIIFTCQKIRYQIEISVKDGKYKFDVIDIERPNNMYPQFTNNPWEPMRFDYNKKGELRFKMLDDLPKEFNRLNDELKRYILDSDVNSPKNDW